MKKEIAMLWADELESGKWKQGRSMLNMDGKLCCLGVLCELAILSGRPVERVDYTYFYLYDGQDNVLPISVMNWSGMKTSGGMFGNDALWVHNDERLKTFPEIAAIIREHWEEL